MRKTIQYCLMLFKNTLKIQAVSILNLFWMLTLSYFFFILFQINERLWFGCGNSEGPSWNRSMGDFRTLFIYLFIHLFIYFSGKMSMIVNNLCHVGCIIITIKRKGCN